MDEWPSSLADYPYFAARSERSPACLTLRHHRGHYGGPRRLAIVPAAITFSAEAPAAGGVATFTENLIRPIGDADDHDVATWPVITPHRPMPERVAATIYGVNLLLAAVLLAALWRYATRSGLLRTDIADEDRLILTRRLTPGLAGYVALIVIGLFWPTAAVIG